MLKFRRNFRFFIRKKIPKNWNLLQTREFCMKSYTSQTFAEINKSQANLTADLTFVWMSCICIQNKREINKCQHVQTNWHQILPSKINLNYRKSKYLRTDRLFIYRDKLAHAMLLYIVYKYKSTIEGEESK
jgi:hypothetical protein